MPSFLRNIVCHATEDMMQSKALHMSCVTGEPSCSAQQMTSKHAILHINTVELSCCHAAATAQGLISTTGLGTYPCVPGICHQAHNVVTVVPCVMLID